MASVSSLIVENSAEILARALAAMDAAGNLPKQSWSCDAPNGSNDTRTAFDDAVKQVVDDDSTYLYKLDKYDVPMITAPVEIDVTTKNVSKTTEVGVWDPKERFQQAPEYTPGKIRRFFRVGEAFVKQSKRALSRIILN